MEPHLLYVLNTLLVLLLVFVASAAVMATTFALVACILGWLDLVGKVSRHGRRRGPDGLIPCLLSSKGTAATAAGFVLLLPTPGSVEEVAIDVPPAKSGEESPALLE